MTEEPGNKHNYGIAYGLAEKLRTTIDTFNKPPRNEGDVEPVFGLLFEIGSLLGLLANQLRADYPGRIEPEEFERMKDAVLPLAVRFHASRIRQNIYEGKPFLKRSALRLEHAAAMAGGWDKLNGITEEELAQLKIKGAENEFIMACPTLCSIDFQEDEEKVEEIKTNAWSMAQIIPKDRLEQIKEGAIQLSIIQQEWRAAVREGRMEGADESVKYFEAIEKFFDFSAGNTRALAAGMVRAGLIPR